MDEILGRLYEDLERLYDGVNIQTANGECELFGALVSICGDTLAQHEFVDLKRVLVSTIVSAGSVNVRLRM